VTERLTGVCGIVAILGLAWVFSRNRRRVPWRVIAWGLGLQTTLALVVLHTPPGLWLFETVNDTFVAFTGFAGKSAAWVFGRGADASAAGILAIQIAAIIIFFASVMGVLYHLGVMQRVVRAMAWVMARTMGTSGAESLSCAVNVFVGQTEAPLIIRPYLATLTESELMTVMTGGFATIAGSVMGAYVAFGADAGHLLTASLMSAPAAVVISKILLPESETPQTLGTVRLACERTTVNVVDAAAAGAADGLRLALNVIGMLLAFVAMIYAVDALLAWANPSWSLAGLFGGLFRPIAYVMGVRPEDAPALASLLGTQVTANEFLAYQRLTAVAGEPVAVGTGILQDIAPRTYVIATYALCGFANLGSVAIQIGGIGALVPERRADLARMGLRAMAAGALACWLTACVAGLLISDAEAAYKHDRLIVRKQVALGRIEEAAGTSTALVETVKESRWAAPASRLRDELGRAREAAQALTAGRAAEARALLAPLAETADLPALRRWASERMKPIDSPQPDSR
jgi:CNT family concentrative nucleoside transporter